MQNKNSEECVREAETVEQKDRTVVCDLCGRPVTVQEVWATANNNTLLCPECRAEEESCACSD